MNVHMCARLCDACTPTASAATMISVEIPNHASQLNSVVPPKRKSNVSFFWLSFTQHAFANPACKWSRTGGRYTGRTILPGGTVFV
jgi:hypothetical protein